MFWRRTPVVFAVEEAWNLASHIIYEQSWVHREEVDFTQQKHFSAKQRSCDNARFKKHTFEALGFGLASFANKTTYS